MPPALALRKEVEDLPGLVRELATEEQVRLAVDRLNDRILDALRKPGEGPAVTVMAVDVAEIVLGWRFARIARRQAVRAEPAVERAAEHVADDGEPIRAPRAGRRRWRRG